MTKQTKVEVVSYGTTVHLSTFTYIVVLNGEEYETGLVHFHKHRLCQQFAVYLPVPELRNAHLEIHRMTTIKSGQRQVRRLVPCPLWPGPQDHNVSTCV